MIAIALSEHQACADCRCRPCFIISSECLRSQSLMLMINCTVQVAYLWGTTTSPSSCANAAEMYSSRFFPCFFMSLTSSLAMSCKRSTQHYLQSPLRHPSLYECKIVACIAAHSKHLKEACNILHMRAGIW